ncbi:hypothetical protein EIP91_010786 [Steccherinum ochraceum]|uniref:O-methyltransferase C-terminal domain-containing protein n=1 Tax=Steccherinum ochraceum TaxID=92696 RepID=A0A4R0R8S3_9APHY|nr:hypothetical protein EIP91_010786 [Steccherinum ochraceum]
MSGNSDLQALSDIITSSVDQILSVCKAKGKDFPRLDKPIHPSEFTPEGIRNDPQVSDAIALVVTAAFQLIQTVRSPPVTLVTESLKSVLPTCLGIAERADVAEILRDAGPKVSKGKHVNEIAAHSGIDSRKLARVLRCLATHHYFIEVSPDVFANNLLSSLMDSGKDISEPNFRENKHVGAQRGMAAMAGFGPSVTMKCLAEWPEMLFDPKTTSSDEASGSGWRRAMKTDKDMWDYFATPEGRYNAIRFNATMANANKLHPPQAAVKGFDWASLPKGALVVDVGAGRGHVSLEVARAFPDLQVAVEDRSVVIADAKQYWTDCLPSHVKEGKVHFIECDFLQPQPKLPKTPDVFLLRQIIHDWSDRLCVQLLTHLKAAAGPHTKLLIIDCIVEYACVSETQAALTVDSNASKVPKPLLPNLAGANLHAYQADIVLGSVLNAGERTVDGFKSIYEAAGWKLVEVRKNPASKLWWPTMVCEPA